MSTTADILELLTRFERLTEADMVRLRQVVACAGTARQPCPSGRPLPTIPRGLAAADDPVWLERDACECPAPPPP